jgi:hypothetical protein
VTQPAIRSKLVASRQAAAGRGAAQGGPALRGDDDGGRCFAPTALRCSPRGRAAKLAALATRAPLRQSPRVRSTKRASRADPEAALLGAADIAPKRRAPLRRAPPSRCLPLSMRRWRSSAKRARFSRTPRRFLQRRGRRCAPPAPGAPRAQPRSAGAPACARSALRASDSRRLSERSSRSERSEFRRAGRRSEHRRAPPRSGGKHQARPAQAARTAARAFARANLTCIARRSRRCVSEQPT